MNAYQKWRICERKKAYKTLSKANKAIARHKALKRAYECPVCFCWHTTKKLTNSNVRIEE